MTSSAAGASARYASGASSSSPNARSDRNAVPSMYSTRSGGFGSSKSDRRATALSDAELPRSRHFAHGASRREWSSCGTPTKT